MKKCVLIFDDEQEILFVTKIILEKHNYRVETRTSCANLLADVELVKPDIILMDLWIPPISGENAIRLLKADPATKNVAVILFSANTDIEKIAARANAEGFLKKPFEITSLLEIIESSTSQLTR
jgi:CheY-like chemotaxis protein